MSGSLAAPPLLGGGLLGVGGGAGSNPQQQAAALAQLYQLLQSGGALASPSRQQAGAQPTGGAGGLLGLGAQQAATAPAASQARTDYAESAGGHEAPEHEEDESQSAGQG